MKNEDDECFRWCHIRHLNPQSKGPQRIKKADKQHIDNLDYSNIVFPVSEKQYNKIEKQNSIRINVFGYEKRQPFPIHVSEENFEDQMNLLLITGNEKKHYVLIKNFNPIWTGGGAKWPPEGFAKYLKNGSVDLHETLWLLRPLYRSSFKITSLRIGLSLLPW